MSVAAYRHHAIGLAALAMARPRTVGRRIDRILAAAAPSPRPGPRARALITLSLVPLTVLSAVSIAADAPQQPGTATGAGPVTPASATQIAADERSVLDGYVGFYVRESQDPAPLVYAITPDGDRLFIGLGNVGAGRSVLFPAGGRRFFWREVSGWPDAEVTFVPDDKGRIIALAIHQEDLDGIAEDDVTARRVDATEAERATAAHQRRIEEDAQPRTAITTDPAAFDRHVGYYQLSPKRVVSVTREGDQLFFQETARPRNRLFAESETTFFTRDTHALISFETGTGGRTTGLVLRQGGWTSAAKRVDESEAKHADAALAERVRRKAERIADEQRPRATIAIDPRVLDRYVGLYAQGGIAPLSITREGDQLFVSNNGQPRRPIFPERENEFFFKDVAAQISFVGEGDGPAGMLILHQDGMGYTARRIADLAKPDQTRAGQDALRLDDNVGWFQLELGIFDTSVIAAVTRDGDRLFVQMNRMRRIEIFPLATGGYASSDGRTQIRFKADGTGRVTEIVLRTEERGERHGTRIPDAEGREREELAVRHVAAGIRRFVEQKPPPGGEAAVRDLIEVLPRDGAHDDIVGAEVADRLRRSQWHFLQYDLRDLGSIQAVSFKDVALNGRNIYAVTFDNGMVKVSIDISADGKIETADFGIGVESTGAPGGVAACSQQADLKPVATPFHPIFMTILNRSGQDIKVFRLNAVGQRTSVSTPLRMPVGNDRSARVLGDRSSLVIVTDASDNCLEAILPGETTRTVTVRPPGGAPGETTTPRRLPLLGGEDALRRYIEDARRGEPKYEQMLGDAQDVTRGLLGRIRAILIALGATQSVTFVGVGPADDDIYHVKFDNGTSEWRIDVTADGMIRRIALGPE